MLTDKQKKVLVELTKAILTAIVAALGTLYATSCGSTTKAYIRNAADGTSTTVSITTNNPTNWQVSPNTDLKLK